MATTTAPCESEIEQHFGLVNFTLKKYIPLQGRQSADFEDLQQIGKIELLKAIRRYDPNKGAFTTYAVYCIRFGVWKYLQRKRKDGLKVPRTVGAENIQVLSIDQPIGEGEITLLDIFSTDDDLTEIQVDEFVQSLPDRERKLLLYRLEGASQKEIAKEMGISQTHISRLLKRIGEKYLEGGEVN